MRTIVITGCAGGIGLETALAFAAHGDHVVATMRDPARGGRLIAAADALGLADRIEIAGLDVTRARDFPDFVAGVLDRRGRIDVLVNNAGILSVGAFEDIGEAEFRRVMETNFFGAALLTRAVLPQMRAQQGGRIIMVGSLSGLAGRAGDSVYAASKFALEGFAEALRQEVARWNIRIALIEPAGVATGLFRDTPPADGSPYRPLTEALRRQAAAGGGGDPAAIAGLIVDVSRSRARRLRWAADPTAERVMARLSGLDDVARLRFLDEVAGVDWWMAGADAPPA